VAIAVHGRAAMTAAVRAVLGRMRTAGGVPGSPDPADVAAAAARQVDALARPSQRPVLNLTGTVLHTNLGRAVLAEAAREAVLAAMSGATNLEYDLEKGQRGERDDHVRGLLTELTGAESAIAVNNNASAVILTLAALAKGRETIVSRGELVEIGGSFRMPDIMAAAGTTLREVGTTNRTHARDYESAISPDTALLMKVHTSNYAVQGFTAEVAHREVARIAHAAGLPFVDDLGSGALVDMARWGLTPERSVATAIADGADLVTFSGDKMLGGPQAGLIVGRRDLVAQLAKHPLKRAVRLDRMRLAALEATLRLYRDPDRLAERLPTLRWLTRTRAEVRKTAEEVLAHVSAALGPAWSVTVVGCQSETGSGSLPLATMPSAGLAIVPSEPKPPGRALDDLAARLRRLPMPVIGRIHDGRLILDLRCLDEPRTLTDQFGKMGTVPFSVHQS
jgi:L-seryl-tRNA(Ser) seleniumtransferase